MRLRAVLKWSKRLFVPAVLSLMLAGAMPAPAMAETKAFATPEDAVKAMIEALKTNDEGALQAVFGPALDEWLRSGDDVADKTAREAFLASYAQKQTLEKPDPNQAVLVVGPDEFPFPIPVVKSADGWRFDPDLGHDEIIARRVGRNELSTIQTLLAVADAQDDYANLQRKTSGIPSYSARFLSSNGRRDGLYWPKAEGEPESPLGPLVADAAQVGYRTSRNTSKEHTEPFYGYHFRMLRAQGPDARGGAYSYIVNGRMIGGFAVIAWPAKYGVSGYKTFMINQDRTVYERDLGAKTAEVVARIQTFDPGKGWSKVATD